MVRLVAVKNATEPMQLASPEEGLLVIERMRSPVPGDREARCPDADAVSETRLLRRESVRPKGVAVFAVIAFAVDTTRTKPYGSPALIHRARYTPGPRPHRGREAAHGKTSRSGNDP